MAGPGLVLDSAGLIALARLGLLNRVASEFGPLFLPAAVLEEATAGNRPGAIAVRRAVDEDLLSIVPAEHPVEPSRLGPGEGAAIAVARRSDLPVVLDDREARLEAARAGLRVVGTLAVLVALKQAHRIRRLAPFLDRLDGFGFRVARELRDRVLRLAGEEPS